MICRNITKSIIRILRRNKMNIICKLTDSDIGEKSIEIYNPKIRTASRGI